METVKDVFKGVFWVIVLIMGFKAYTSEPKPETPVYLDYTNKTLKEMKDSYIQSSTLEKIAKSYIDDSYANDVNMTHDYSSTLSDCLGQFVYGKEETYKFKKVLDWCVENFKNKKEVTYYNTAKLLDNFSAWDGSYYPLETLIKESMNDRDSYEHIETRYFLVYYGAKRPHMRVSTAFRGKNAFGAVVRNEVSVKVDAITNELFDIKQ